MHVKWTNSLDIIWTINIYLHKKQIILFCDDENGFEDQDRLCQKKYYLMKGIC